MNFREKVGVAPIEEQMLYIIMSKMVWTCEKITKRSST